MSTTAPTTRTIIRRLPTWTAAEQRAYAVARIEAIESSLRRGGYGHNSSTRAALGDEADALQADVRAIDDGTAVLQ